MVENKAKDEFQSIRDIKRKRLIVKGSRFIATVFPIQSEEEVKGKIEKIKKEFFDATHLCFAFRIGTEEKEFIRFSDGGEPSGTAGKPILSAIQSERLTNILVVVTRYFGGTKLGTGGLARAYKESALNLLSECERMTQFVEHSLSLSFPLHLIGAVQKTLGQFHCLVQNREFGEEVSLNIKIRKSKEDQLRKTLTEITHGKIKFL